VGLLFNIIKSQVPLSRSTFKTNKSDLFIALYEIGMLDRRADLAFHIVFPIANMPAITVLSEIGVLDRRADPALHIGL